MAVLRRTAGNLLFWLLIVAVCGIVGWYAAGRQSREAPERATAVSGAAESGIVIGGSVTEPDRWEW